MKATIKISVSLIFTLIAVSCSDFLDEINKTGKTEDIVYSGESAITNLVGSC
jgi:hypothetical protein